MIDRPLRESMEAVDWVDWLHFAVGVGCIVWLVADAVSRLVGHPVVAADSLLFAAGPTALMTALLTWPESGRTLGLEQGDDSEGAE